MNKRLILLILALPLILMISLFATANTVSIIIKVPVTSVEIVLEGGHPIVYLNLDDENAISLAGKFTEETKDKAEWWTNDEIINAKDRKTGDALVEVRQGLVDRSKSPFYLVNNADYEAIQ